MGHKGETAMASNAVVRARIDEVVKEEATHVLDRMGLSVSDAIRMLMIRIAREKAIPFDMRIPNVETRTAMRELQTGGGKTFSSVADLMTDLDEDD
jgi:DNA-damage-inducible protein J